MNTIYLKGDSTLIIDIIIVDVNLRGDYKPIACKLFFFCEHDEPSGMKTGCSPICSTGKIEKKFCSPICSINDDL